MNSATLADKPVQAAVFNTSAAAHAATSSLLRAGFTQREITVVCSDETKEQHFRQFEHQEQAGANTPAAAAVGGAVGATLFGLSAVAAGAASGGVPLAIAGGWALLTGGVAGGFLGAMLTRGFEKEVANFYDQAVATGKILVTVEVHGPEAQDRLQRAARILKDSGAEPVPLVEG